MSEEKRLVTFLKTAGRLKREPRRGWVVKAGVSDPESVADHTFRTVLLTMLIGDLRGLDTEKMVKMAVIHDLAETVIGDLTPVDAELEMKERGESKAIEELFSNLPAKLREGYLSLWYELRSGSSEEARLVAEADKLEMALQASEYMDEGYSRKVLDEFKESAAERISDRWMRDVMRFI